MAQIIIHDLPNRFFYYVAKNYLKAAYSERVAYSFYNFKISRKNSLKSGIVRVECFNGGAFVSMYISEDKIIRKGHYRKHRPVNTKLILSDAFKNIDNIPNYYSVQFQDNIDCFQRCLDDIELGKKRVIGYWNEVHRTSPIEEPINWIIKQV